MGSENPPLAIGRSPAFSPMAASKDTAGARPLRSTASASSHRSSLRSAEGLLLPLLMAEKEDAEWTIELVILEQFVARLPIGMAE